MIRSPIISGGCQYGLPSVNIPCHPLLPGCLSTLRKPVADSSNIVTSTARPFHKAGPVTRPSMATRQRLEALLKLVRPLRSPTSAFRSHPPTPTRSHFEIPQPYLKKTCIFVYLRAVSILVDTHFHRTKYNPRPDLRITQEYEKNPLKNAQNEV